MSINYPNKKKNVNHNVIYSHRGMNFEKQLNDTNKYYKAHEVAVIHKKPTPVQIVKVDYPNRQRAVIREAYFQAPSTTDYNGVYKGRYIDFEAKETSSKTSLPIQNIHKHQIEHIKSVINHGGIAFLLVKFNKLDKVYLLDGSILLDHYEQYLNNGSKSLSIKTFIEKGHEVNQKVIPSVDYLKVVDSLYYEAKN